ncbi:M56 family metallopeptidase [Brevibacterium otitidis]|uniref:M56 family metallopeptidase n=1 Tax=Brevibacterium otitidis TaxID=53364 RepID=A0ABV5X6C0_9MICO|nr:M56 family metallopeptidase [Brevibacterium otitidis]
MAFSAALLTALAVALAWPIPRLFARHPGSRDPAARLLLWQAIGLAGGLSLTSAVLLWAFLPFTRQPGAAGLLDGHGLSVLSWWNWMLAGLGILLLLRLLSSLAIHWFRVRRQRRRHAALITVLTEPSQELPHTRILPVDEAVAYCLPHGQHGTTVLSTGLIDALSSAERDAVVAHERAHLSCRHELVVLPFAAWQHALPFLPVARQALDQVTRLIEVMADDIARRQVDAADLAAAVRQMSRLQAGRHSRKLTAERLARLAHPPETPSMRLRAAVTIVSAALVISPPVVAALELAGL